MVQLGFGNRPIEAERLQLEGGGIGFSNRWCHWLLEPIQALDLGRSLKEWNNSLKGNR